MSGLSGGSLALGPAQTLTGFGTVNGGVTSGGTGSQIIPGSLSSIGTLATGNLDLSAGANLTFVLGATGGGTASPGNGSLINVSGNLTLPSTQIANLNLLNNNNANGKGSIGSGYYDLFNYTGSLTGNPLTAFGPASPPRSITSRPSPAARTSFSCRLPCWRSTGPARTTAQAPSIRRGAATPRAPRTGPTRRQSSSRLRSRRRGDVRRHQPRQRRLGLEFRSHTGDQTLPTSITFSNSAVNYSITGLGGITGTTGIVLNGTGNVVLGTSNSFTSPVQINAGSLTITNATELGNATQATVASGGVPQIQGGIFANPVPLSLSGSPGWQPVLPEHWWAMAASIRIPRPSHRSCDNRRHERNDNAHRRHRQ